MDSSILTISISSASAIISLLSLGVSWSTYRRGGQYVEPVITLTKPDLLNGEGNATPVDMTIEIRNHGNQLVLIREISIDLRHSNMNSGLGKRVQPMSVFSEFDNCLQVPAFDAIALSCTAELPPARYGFFLAATVVTKTGKKFHTRGVNQRRLLSPAFKEMLRNKNSSPDVGMFIDP
jgi:hypothetical protein